MRQEDNQTPPPAPPVSPPPNRCGGADPVVIIGCVLFVIFPFCLPVFIRLSYSLPHEIAWGIILWGIAGAVNSAFLGLAMKHLAKKSREKPVNDARIGMIICGMGLIFYLSVATYFFFTRNHHYHTRCVSNQRFIESAKEQWAIDNNKTAGAVCTWSDVVGEKAYIKTSPVCPAGGTYTLGKIGEVPTCSVPVHNL